MLPVHVGNPVFNAVEASLDLVQLLRDIGGRYLPTASPAHLFDPFRIIPHGRYPSLNVGFIKVKIVGGL